METTDRINESCLSSDEEQPTLSHSSSQKLQDDLSPQNSQPKTRGESAKSRSKSKKESKDAKKKKPRVIFNISDTRYEVVKYVGRKLLGFKLTPDLDVEWDIFWTDNAVQPETLAKMQPFQKINHFPGMYSLARKNHLGRHLMRMKKLFPKNYKFFPQTYLLPAEYSEFRNQFGKNKKPMTFIAKPEASCQGRGIFLTRNGDDIEPGEHYVVQRYLHKPFLLDGLKFDLRIYVLLAGCDPLRIYLFDDGLGRFATEEYIAPTSNNLENMCMHLTNYAINKDNPNFVFNESAKDNNVGHKRSLKAVFKTLEEKGYDVKTLWAEIKKIIIKTFCSVQPILAHSYKSCQPDEPYNNMCFEILGFDIILDHKLKPWLLEVNHTPSFTTDTPLDKQIKRNVIKDALSLMNISVNNRIKYKNKKKVELQQRVLTGKKIKLTAEEKQAVSEKAQKERDIWESSHLGGYEKIYPLDVINPNAAEDYGEYIQASYKWWEEWTGTAIKKNPKKTITVIDATKSNGFTINQTNMIPSTSQSSRAKEIQNIYSQKLKIGSSNLKSSSNKKTRKGEGPGVTVSKNNESFQETSATTQSGFHKNEEKNDKAKQAWNLNQLEQTLTEQNKIVGEDDRELEFEIAPIIEQESCFEVVKEDNEDETLNSGIKEKKMKSSKLLTQSGKKQLDSFKTSNFTDEAFLNGTPVEVQRAASFKVRKPAAMHQTLVKDMGYKAPKSRADKENPRNNEQAGHFVSPYKFPTVWNSNGTSKFVKLPEKAEMDGRNEENTQDKMTTFYKPPKSMTRIIGETQVLDETPISFSLINQERKVRTSCGTDSTKVGNSGNDWYPKSLPKKNITVNNVVQQQKSFIGNFVTPKIFDMNMKTSKGSQQRDNSLGASIQAGLMSTYGRSLSKGVSLQRDVSSPPVGGGYVRDIQTSYQKYSNPLPLDLKKKRE